MSLFLYRGAAGVAKLVYKYDSIVTQYGIQGTRLFFDFSGTLLTERLRHCFIPRPHRCFFGDT